MADFKRRCKNCGKFGHYAKTCKNKKVKVTGPKKSPPKESFTRPTPSIPPTKMTNQHIETSFPEVEETQVEETSSVEFSDREAVGAEALAAELEASIPEGWGDAGEGESGESGEPGEVVDRETGPSESAGEPPGEAAKFAFQKGIETVLSVWELAILKDLSPPEEIRILVAKAWTDVAEAYGWLDDTDDPTMKAIMATGVTAGTYGVATWKVYERKRDNAK